MKFSKLAAVAALAAIAVPASVWAEEAATATQGAGLAAGATVYDPQGGEVGTISQVSGDIVIVDTGTNQATLGKASFAEGPNGPMIALTKTELDTMVEKAAAEAAAALAAAIQVGAEVRSMDGIVLGAISAIEETNVMVDVDGSPVALKREYFAMDPANGLIVRFTAQALKDAMAAQAGA